ncbi:MAG: hypothetical protein ACK5AS_01560 [Bacteroidota bacterium]|jgi:hypothetical protein
MKNLKIIFSLLLLILIRFDALADLKYHPVSFMLSTDKECYYEGEKITFLITITNNDKGRTLPVLLPHTQNVGQKLFYLNAYDKANNTMLLRYTEDKLLKMMVHDTGTVKIKYLKPLEQVVVPIYLNDFENYFSYHTQNASHHSFGVPLFAGVYKVNVTYNPNGIALGDSIYTYYDDSEKDIPINRLAMPSNGQISQMIDLKIKRSADTIVTIERQKYYIKTDGHRYFYLSKNARQITTDTSCHHITDLPPDSSSIKNEYFYSHFNDLYAEYIARFDDGDIREYRKFSDWCPSFLYTERYNEFKQKTHYELQLPDKRFYSVSYNQPSGSIYQETYCSSDGTLCNVTTYIYDKQGILKRKVFSQTQPCIEVEIDGKKRSAHRGINLEEK